MQGGAIPAGSVLGNGLPRNGHPGTDFLGDRKNGLDNKLIDEINLQLKKRKLVKVKILKGAIDEKNLDKKKMPEEIARLTDSEVMQKVGFVFTLYKE